MHEWSNDKDEFDTYLSNLNRKEQQVFTIAYEWARRTCGINISRTIGKAAVDNYRLETAVKVQRLKNSE